MKYESINPKLFINNRSLLANKLKENSIAIFNSNDVMPTNSDGTMPFKQNSDLLRGNMRLNADGIKVDDFVSYNTSDLFYADWPFPRESARFIGNVYSASYDGWAVR